MNPKTFANHRANARMALLWFNRQTPGCGRTASMDAVLSIATGKGSEPLCAGHAVALLSVTSPQMAFGLSDVRDNHVDAYVAYRKATSF